MEKTTLREIMEAQNSEEGRKKIEKYVFAGEASQKQIKNAIDTYAPGVKFEEVVAIMDTSVWGSGKDGFLFTEDRMYGKCLKGGPVDLKKLKFAAIAAGVSYSKNQLLYKDGTRYPLSIGANIELEKVMPLLQRLTGCEKAEERPAEEDGEFLRYHRTFIGGQIKEIAERYSKKISQIYFPESMEPGLLSDLIQKTGADLKPEEIIAVHGFGMPARNGALFTSDAYYPCYIDAKSKIPVYYTGLESAVISGDHILMVYENGYVQGIPNVKETKQDQEILSEIIAVIREIKNNPPETEDRKLSSIEGWKEFQDRRGKGALEACKNSVFVSSTFKDMHFERDIIHERVLPALNKAGMEYGQTISFCDLRWGVNTGELDSEEGSKKVLSVCLNEIERCKPYMIVILGERYGWIPEEKTIVNALEGQPDFTLDDLEKSVTALEIEFGALAHTGQIDRTFFYFRKMKGNPSDIYKSEDARHAEKLRELKERIRRLAGKQIKSYTVSWNEEKEYPAGIDSFAEMVIEDVRNAMEEEWKLQADKTDFQKELHMHWELAEKKALQCAARDTFVLNCLNRLEQGENLLVITGESGSGKSTLMGCLAVTLRLSGAKVLPVFCGYTAQSDTAIEIVQNIVHFLEACLGQEGASDTDVRSEKEWLEHMNRLAEGYAEKGKSPVVFVIDAVDQLLADDLRDSLRFLPSCLTDKVKVVLSCLTEFPLPYVPDKQELPLMKREDKPEVIRGILRLHRREVEAPVIRAISEKSSSDHPLYMNLLIQRLLMMNKNDFDDIAEQGDGMSAITRHQLKLVEESADDLPGICRDIFHSAGERLGSGFVETAMECLAVSRHGLRESDLEGILSMDSIQWNTLDFSLFINYLRSLFLIRDDGRIDFSHKSFREGLRVNLEEEKYIHEKIWTWLDSLPETDEVRAQELIYHGILADKKSGILAAIQRHSEDELFLKQAAKTFALYSRTDDGRWVEESLKCGAGLSVDASYIFFLTVFLNRELDYYEKDDRLRERIYLAALPAAGQIAEISHAEKDLRTVSMLNNRLGTIYNRQDTEEGYGKALAYFKKSLAISKELEAAYHTDETWRNLAVDNYALGAVYLKIDYEGNHEKAVRHYEESIRLAEKAAAERPTEKNQVTLGWAYKKMAELHRSDKEKEKALECFEKAIEIRENVVRENPAIVHQKNLCYLYDDAAYVHFSYMDDGHRRQALEYFEKEALWWEEIIKNERSVQNLYWLGDSYCGAGDCCYYMQADGPDRESNKKQALEYYKKSIPILNEVCQAGKNVKSRLAICCENAAGLAYEFAGASNLSMCREWAGKAVLLYEEIVKDEDSEKAYSNWADMLYLYHKYFQGTEQAFRCLEKYIGIMELLYKRTKNKTYKSNIKRVKAIQKLEGATCKI